MHLVSPPVCDSKDSFLRNVATIFSTSEQNPLVRLESLISSTLVDGVSATDTITQSQEQQSLPLNAPSYLVFQDSHNSSSTKIISEQPLNVTSMESTVTPRNQEPSTVTPCKEFKSTETHCAEVISTVTPRNKVPSTVTTSNQIPPTVTSSDEIQYIETSIWDERLTASSTSDFHSNEMPQNSVQYIVLNNQSYVQSTSTELLPYSNHIHSQQPNYSLSAPSFTMPFVDQTLPQLIFVQNTPQPQPIVIPSVDHVSFIELSN